MPMPAYLRNGRFDVLAANDLGRALYSPLYEQAGAGDHPNSARFLFLDPAATEFFVDYDKAANDCVAFLRAEAGRDPYAKELSDLVGELSTRSEDFRRRWAAHDVRYHRTGRKRFHHPLVGDLELDYEAFELPGDVGQRINVYTAPPDSPSAERTRPAGQLDGSGTNHQPGRGHVHALTHRHCRLRRLPPLNEGAPPWTHARSAHPDYGYPRSASAAWG